MRPRQWAKNLLVVAAPAAAGALGSPRVIGQTLLAFVAFTIAAAGTYLLNDLADREADARHPIKRDRPVASGALPTSAVAVVGVFLAVAAVLLPVVVGLRTLAVIIGIYLALTSAYSLWLKHEPLFDLAAVAAGFLLRPLGGAAASDLRTSRWFLTVAAFGALNVVANKRYAELRRPDAVGRGTRRALDGYSPELLREIRFTSAAVTIAAYVTWAFDTERWGGSPWFGLSIVPVVLGIYRYAAVVDAGLGESPEDILLTDRLVQGLAVAWLLLFGIGVYG